MAVSDEQIEFMVKTGILSISSMLRKSFVAGCNIIHNVKIFVIWFEIVQFEIKSK